MKPTAPPKKAKLSARQRALSDLCLWLKRGELRFAPRGVFDAPGDYGFYKQLVSQAVRYKSKWVHFAAQLSDRPAHQLDTEALGAIILGLVQLSGLVKTEPWAAIDESVKSVETAGKAHLKPLVNASLRRFQRDQPSLEAGLSKELSLSFPKWLLKGWSDTYGAELADQLATASNVEPALWLVAHPDLGATGLRDQLQTQGFDCSLNESGVQVRHPAGLFESPLFLSGQFFVQDPSAQAALRVALPYVSGRVWDGCAAPGGKLAHLAWYRQNPLQTLVATEPNGRRFERLKENVQRLHLEVELHQAEAECYQDPEGFDFILADVPCSATGTLGKHPEIKWNRKPQDLSKNHQTQVDLVASMSTQLKPGGALLYSTCSLEPQENQAVVEALLASGLGLDVCPLGSYLGQYHLSLPRPGQGGSFAALLRRTH